MNYLRKLLLFLSVSILPLTLFGFGLGLGLYQVLGTPQAIKSALAASGVYTLSIDDIMQQTDKSGDALPTDQPAVKDAFTKAFTPGLLQDQANGAVDGIYNWLTGKTDTLSVETKLSQAKDSLAVSLGDYAEKRLATLPTCADNNQVGPDFDPISASCKPTGIDSAATRQIVQQKIAQSDFLQDKTISADTIKDDQGHGLSERFDTMPTIYQAVIWGVAGAGVISLLASVAITFTSATRRGGIKRVAITYITIGVISGVLALGVGIAVDQLTKHFNDSTAQIVQGKAIVVAGLLVHDLRTWWLSFGIISAVVGIGLLVWLKLTKPTATSIEGSGLPIAPVAPEELNFPKQKHPLT